MIRTTDEEPMTKVERYSTAIESSNLRMKEGRGDLDVIISAGLLGTDPDDKPARRLADALAARLLRLRREYDKVRAAHRAAEMARVNNEAAAKRESGEEGEESAEERTETMLAIAERATLTAHVLLLVNLPSLRTVKEMVGVFALDQAKKMRFKIHGETILRLSGTVLDVHISPTCRHCDGRGFNGNLGKGERQAVCRPCRGTGTRRDSVGKDNDERAFVGHMLLELDALLGVALDEMSRREQGVRATKALIRAAEHQREAFG